MKILHISDVHLDSKMDGFPAEFSKKRREEILSLFEKAVVFASSNGVRVIILAGDLFDTERVFDKTKKRLYKIFKDNLNIDFLLLKGNHDKLNFIEEVSLELPNVKEFGSEWINYNYDNVNICGINGERGIDYSQLELPVDCFNIAVLHGQIADYNTTNSNLISLPNLRGKNLDYVALGHLHNYYKNKLDERGVICYSGCLEGRGFDEVGEKGFVLIDTENLKNKSTFIPFATSKILVKDYVFNGEDFSDFCFSVINDIKLNLEKNTILKIVLKGQSSKPIFIDAEFIKNKVEEHVDFAEIDNKIVFIPEENANSASKTIKEEFISLVLKTDIENLMKNDVIMCGINALSGEEI